MKSEISFLTSLLDLDYFLVQLIYNFLFAEIKNWESRQSQLSKTEKKIEIKTLKKEI